MVKDIGIKLIEPNGLLVGNKMYLMSFIGEGLSKFGGQNTASTKSGVTNNPYTHIKLNGL
jgi:hypothetical protein